MDSYHHIWRRISRHLKVAKNSAKEDNYQLAIYDIFLEPDFLGWPENRVIREYPVQMGSTKKADIVLLNSDLAPILAIEVKVSNSSSDGIEQLGSYMDRCSPRLEFGIAIKDTFSLFYDENTGRSIHSINDAVISCSFDNPYDEDGIKIVELLSFQNFDVDALKTFCEERLFSLRKKLEREKKVRELSNLLSGDSGRTLINKAICQYLKDNNFIVDGEEDLLDEILVKLPQISSKVEFSLVNTEPNRISKINYKFIPSMEEFVEHLKNNICYRHFILNDGRVETQKWSSAGGITMQTLKPNVNSTPFYRKNKHNIIKIVLSPYKDPYKE